MVLSDCACGLCMYCLDDDDEFIDPLDENRMATGRNDARGDCRRGKPRNKPMR